jgi:hypothetical protein
MFIPHCHNLRTSFDNGPGCLRDFMLLVSVLFVELELHEFRERQLASFHDQRNHEHHGVRPREYRG